MAFNDKLAARVRDILSENDVAIGERWMFGGVCFLVNGAMCCGVMKHDLIVRVVPDEGTNALAMPHTRPFDFTGKPSAGMAHVAPPAPGRPHS
jgi:TfoX N-terminal domain